MQDISESSRGIDADIKAYERMFPSLEGHIFKWVLIHHGKLEGIFESLNDAANEAVPRFGRGPFLIRQIGAPPLVLPSSLMYNPVYA
jgi:hypothetical protein